jgi:putative membrane protein
MMMRWEEMIPGPWYWGWAVLWMMMLTAFWILVLLGLALVVRWLWRAGSRPGTAQPEGESAMEILKKRYARGEVGKEEFEAKKRDLL